MISTHVLDTAAGRPAAGVNVTLEVRAGAAWQKIGEGVTDADGRLRALHPAAPSPGVYRLTFRTGAYLGPEAFFPEVQVVFSVRDGAHVHVPLLLSPFGYSTYRGS